LVNGATANPPTFIPLAQLARRRRKEFYGNHQPGKTADVSLLAMTAIAANSFALAPW
jgi:hypothetical protein